MKRNLITVLTLSTLILISFGGCKKGGLNVFSIEDDKNFGLQMEQEIAADPAQFPLLSRTQYASSYAYLDNLKQEILNAGQIEHKDDFQWKLYIVHDDAIQNAFCTPGGYIYVYTGLIKYLDNASSLAGVIGHEMAHADRRHSTQQLTAQYGFSLMVSVIAGTTGQDQIAQIVGSLSSLAYSRDHEKDADAHSVIYLCPTQYRADGAADFFEKIENSGGSSVPAFLSTHPDPGTRVTNIRAKKTELGCTGNPSGSTDGTAYSTFKAGLPN
ncbi:MAG TPA: M48 family metalloprotease [Chitinophagales bacterium]|nr:M48 family metalloprotease [Chitinophagales bacterium]